MKLTPDELRQQGWAMQPDGSWSKMKFAEPKIMGVDLAIPGTDRTEKKAMRVRQSSRPKMNKLEAEYFAILSAQYPNYPRPRAQAKTYVLGNGVRFTPDITATSWPAQEGALGPSIETAWEIKGKHAWDDAIVKIKMAATIWPEISWRLCWKENGEWKVQVILN